MYGIGIDITTVSRIEKSCKNESFIKKVYGEDEVALFCKEKIKYSSLAANFAAKEAFSKALGTGVIGFNLKDVQILRDSKKAPYFKFSNEALKIVDDLNVKAFVSLTHEKDTAAAFVVLIKK